MFVQQLLNEQTQPRTTPLLIISGPYTVYNISSPKILRAREEDLVQREVNNYCFSQITLSVSDNVRQTTVLIPPSHRPARVNFNLTLKRTVLPRVRELLNWFSFTANGPAHLRETMARHCWQRLSFDQSSVKNCEIRELDFSHPLPYLHTNLFVTQRSWGGCADVLATSWHR